MRVELEDTQVGCCDNCGKGLTEAQIAVDNGDEILCRQCKPKDFRPITQKEDQTDE